MSASFFTGWGGTPRSQARGVTFASNAEAANVLSAAGARGLIGRGLGRTYGDASQNAGGTVAESRLADRIVGWDDTSGAVTVQAGVTIDQLLRWSLPRGYFVPVIPGTRHVTIGGAIAADMLVEGVEELGDGLQLALPLPRCLAIPDFVERGDDRRRARTLPRPLWRRVAADRSADRERSPSSTSTAR